MKHIPLKQYMDSKRQLLQAVKNTPTTLIEYEIKKYCTISTGEIPEEAVTVPLRPRQIIIVEWIYNNPNTPTIGSIIINENSKHTTYWSEDKFTNWLTRYAKPGKNSGHRV